jgi:hypothetical protein
MPTGLSAELEEAQAGQRLSERNSLVINYIASGE